MKDAITLKILRWDPKQSHKPRYRIYRVPAPGAKTVLELLKEVYEGQDETLAFRPHCCRLGICNCCVVKVNGKNVRGCVKKLNPGEVAEISPAKKNIIRDLACPPSPAQQESRRAFSLD